MNLQTEVERLRWLVEEQRQQIRDLELDHTIRMPKQVGADAPTASARVPIVVGGVEYPTVQAAADAHGISRQAMAKRLAKNK